MKKKKVNGVQSGKKQASNGGKLLRKTSTPKTVKSLAAGVLVNRKKRS